MKNTLKSYLIAVGLLAICLGTVSIRAMESPLKRSRIENGAERATPNCLELAKALNIAAHAVDKDGLTALHAAALADDFQMVKSLLAHGANPALQDKEGNNAAHYAAFTGSHDIVQALIDQPLLTDISRKEKQHRLLTALKAFRLNLVPKDLCYIIFEYLPGLVTGFPKLCKKLQFTKEKLISIITSQNRLLLECKNNNELLAYDFARNSNRSFLARMTNPKNIQKIAEQKVTELLSEQKESEQKEIENKEN